MRESTRRDCEIQPPGDPHASSALAGGVRCGPTDVLIILNGDPERDMVESDEGEGVREGAGARRPEDLRIDYIAASRALVRSIVFISALGLGVVAVIDVVYLRTGNKSGVLFLTDMLLASATALVLSFVIYRITTRSWLRAYATESAYLSVTDISADAVYSVGSDSLITAWSKGAERVFGYSEAEAIGQSIAMVLPDDFLERDSVALEALMADGIATGHRTLCRRSSGEVFPVEASLSLLSSPSGEPDGLLVVVRDITSQLALENDLAEARDELEARVEERTAELKEANLLLEKEVGERARAQVALKESEEHFRSLIENAADIIVVVDHLGRFEYVSPSVEAVFGYSPRELDGVNALTIAHPDDLGDVTLALARITSASGLVETAEFRFRHKDGSHRLLEGIGKSMVDDLGNLRVIINARDVTARKSAEEKIRSLNVELEVSLAELRDLNRELEAFSFSVSHDLRAPLRAIQSFSEMLDETSSGSMDAEGRRLLGIVRRNAAHMSELIEGLLAFSRLGRSEMNVSEVDMTALARAVVSDAALSLDGRVRFEVGELPGARGDPLLLRQVFANLISNAVKFSSKASAPLVEVGGKNEGAQNSYYVRDNGVGFDMAFADRLFGVFQRLHSSDEFEGTGIGLANVQRIVHRHAGRAWAEGRAGEGATFFFTLPA